MNNTNLLLKDTKTKVASLAQYTDYNTISDIRYVFLELPNEIERESNLYNLDSSLQTRTFTYNITQGLNKLVGINKEITEEYNKKVSEDIKNSRENN